MLKTVKTKSHEVMVESFRNINDLINTCDNRKANFGYDREYDSDFTGVKNYEEARNLILKGWTAPLKEVKEEIGKVDRKRSVEVKKTKTETDVAGFMPIVPNALMGLPKSMYNTKVVSKKSKILNVLIDNDYPGHVSKRNVQNYFTKVFAHITLLEKQGFRVRINSMMTFGKPSTKKVHVMKLMLKSENQPMDLQKLMFPIIHTGMLRAIGFDWYERLPNATRIDGYGKPLDKWSNQEQAQQVLDATNSDKSKMFYIHYGCDYKNIFKGVK